LINSLDEAAQAFADAVKQNYQANNEADKAMEEEPEELLGSDEEGPDDDDGEDDAAKSEDESEEVGLRILWQLFLINPLDAVYRTRIHHPTQAQTEKFRTRKSSKKSWLSVKTMLILLILKWTPTLTASWPN
jgi:hypothetical protein